MFTSTSSIIDRNLYFVKNAENLRCKDGEREVKEGGLGRMKEVYRKKKKREDTM